MNKFNNLELPARSQASLEIDTIENNYSKTKSISSAQSTASSKAATSALARAAKSAPAASTSSAVTAAFEPLFDLEGLSFSESFSEATSSTASTSIGLKSITNRGEVFGFDQSNQILLLHSIQ